MWLWSICNGLDWYGALLLFFEHATYVWFGKRLVLYLERKNGNLVTMVAC
jgi:hypothetical protein